MTIEWLRERFLEILSRIGSFFETLFGTFRIPDGVYEVLDWISIFDIPQEIAFLDVFFGLATTYIIVRFVLTFVR